MLDDEMIIAARLRKQWNEICSAVIRYADSVSEDELKQDAIWQALEDVSYPWHIGITSQVPVGAVRVGYVELSLNVEEDLKRMSMLISTLSYLLRKESRRHVIAVLDDSRQYGFSVRHDGADDVTIQKLYPGKVQ
jgi:hypothetical protein